MPSWGHEPMPTITDAAAQLAMEGLPFICLDTCVLFDVVRAPLRPIPDCIQSAMDLASMQATSRCRLILSSLIQVEWGHNVRAVTSELDRHLKSRDRDALAFHEACELLKVPLSFGKPAYQAAGLGKRILEFVTELLTNSIHLSPSDETKAKATERTLLPRRPARKGGGLKDSIILEEYLELSRLPYVAGFARRKVFCSSNTKDYQDGRDLHGDLSSDFNSVGLVFTNSLPWAVHELMKP